MREQVWTCSWASQRANIIGMYGIDGDQLTGPHIFLQHLTGDIYAKFFKNKLLALLENISL